MSNIINFKKILEPGKLISAVKHTSAAVSVAIAIFAPVDKAINEINQYMTPYTTPNPIVQSYSQTSGSLFEPYHDALDEWADDRKRRKEAEAERQLYNASLAKCPYGLRPF